MTTKRKNLFEKAEPEERPNLQIRAFRISDADHKKLRKLAKKNYCNLSEMIRKLIKDAI